MVRSLIGRPGLLRRLPFLLLRSGRDKETPHCCKPPPWNGRWTLVLLGALFLVKVRSRFSLILLVCSAGTVDSGTGERMERRGQGMEARRT